MAARAPGEAIEGFVLSPHARREMGRRGIQESTIRQVLEAPGQRLSVRPGRDVLQSRVDIGGRPVLVRVFVDVDRDPAVVVTAYRTSKIEKYWRSES
jgi:hypothetical protein